MNYTPRKSIAPYRGQLAAEYLLPKRKKLELIFDKIVSYLTNPLENGRKVFLCLTVINTKYIIWDYEILFLGQQKLIDLIKAEVYYSTHKNIADTVIKSALQVISGRTELWNNYAKEQRITPVRVMSTCSKHFVYFFNKNYHVKNNSDYIDTTGTFIPDGFISIQQPSDPHFLDNIGYYTDHDANKSINSIKEIFFERLNIPTDKFLIILTWLVQSIASDNYTLLELIGESSSGKSHAQLVLRELIDPNVEKLNQIPKKIKDLERQTMNSHVMSFDEVEKLPDDIQLFMMDLMSVNGIKITDPADKGREIFVRRPIILNAVVPAVTHEKLLSKTITIELKAHKQNYHIFQNKIVDENLLYSARLELLKLAKYVCNFDQCDPEYNKTFPSCNYRDLYGFSEIGLKISKIIYSTTEDFMKQFNILIQEHLHAKLEGNQTCLYLYLWAKHHPNTKIVKSVTNLINELEGYHDNRYGDWKITPRQFGSDLKKFKKDLKEFGIDCDSKGKHGPCVKWEIKTGDKIDLPTNFFVKHIKDLKQRTKEDTSTENILYITVEKID
jgi:hypothetical protein